MVEVSPFYCLQHLLDQRTLNELLVLKIAVGFFMESSYEGNFKLGSADVDVQEPWVEGYNEGG